MSPLDPRQRSVERVKLPPLEIVDCKSQKQPGDETYERPNDGNKEDAVNAIMILLSGLLIASAVLYYRGLF
jgi:hypothetical protein